jgi:hypothetical protein
MPKSQLPDEPKTGLTPLKSPGSYGDAEVAPYREAVERQIYALLKQTDAGCTGTSCNRRSCGRNQTCEKWCQNIKAYFSWRHQFSPGLAKVEGIMLQLVGRAKAGQKAQKR